MRLPSFITILLFALLSCSVHAETLAQENVPEPLKPWVDWVLQDEEQLKCPYLYNQSSQVCVWPSALDLRLSENGGLFTQQWQVFGEALVQLPGDTRHWPQQVRSDDTELLVQSKDGLPFVTLDEGIHTISGRFHWQELPKSLVVTPDTGLVNVLLNGEKVTQPRFNQQGELWLEQGESVAANEDHLDIDVFRKLIDSHPILVTTTIKLRVSGKQRNVTLSGAVLDNFSGQSLNSALPARLTNTDQLELQLRPGEWAITLTSRAPTDLTNFSVPENQAPWPDHEVWVYEADTAIRQAKVTGPSSIDPNQTQLPNEWKTLPAYLMSGDKDLTLEVNHRGAADTGVDSLRLDRQLWLDYDGQGYTLKDLIRGELVNSERLDATPELQLGRVSLSGEAQYITYGDDESLKGVEIRSSKVSMVAESRYTGELSTPPVNGWQQDLTDVQTTLHLPPGWRLFAANGTDNVPNTWLQSWSLLDIFLVLIIAFSMAYLWGPIWAGLTLLCLVFIWHEPDSPKFIWLVLLSLVALLRVIPAGRLRLALNLMRAFSLVALFLIVLPYMIETIRVSLYPQLENGYYNQHSFDSSFGDTGYSELAMDAVEVEERVMETISKAGSERYVSPSSKAPRQTKRSDINVIDPDSKIQTGFGLPNWQGNRPVSLHWSGPVSADESTKLYLLGPTTNFIIRAIGIVFILLLSWRLTTIERGVWPKPSLSFKSFLPLLLVVSLSPVLLMTPTVAKADALPDEQMLESLHARLTASPDCLLDCAQIESMQLTIDDAALSVRLRVHAATKAAFPILGREGQWMPSQVLLDGEPAKALQRDVAKNLWIAVDQGVHDIVLNGALPQRNSVSLPLPLKPHYIQWRSLDDNWTLEGVENNTAHDGQLQINRLSTDLDSQDLSAGESLLPTFVTVDRSISLGLDWKVTTTVTRHAPDNAPIGLRIPLLEGEQVLSESSGVNDGSISVSMASTQKSFTWTSRLAISDTINLTAAKDHKYLEYWQLEVSPIWHMTSDGIPRSDDASTRGMLWRPWPGESLRLNISRPKGVEGQSLTILSSQVEVLPGKRASDVELTLNTLSSRGVVHDIAVPNGVDVQSVVINGEESRVQQTGNIVKLPLTPGSQTVQVKWRDDKALGNQFRFGEIDLGVASVNSWFTIRPPESRWVMWVDGPVSGPAVLYWGVLVALFILAIGLSASKLTPLNTWQWFLLGVGLSQTETVLIVVVIAWLVGIAFREKFNKPLITWQFNLMQVSLVVITVVALGVIAVAVANGLLGSPDMQIVGNASSKYVLNWYQDRSASVLAQPLVISVPMWVYRALMLLWALWLAKSVLDWLRWEWTALNVGGLWKKKAIVHANSGAAPKP